MGTSLPPDGLATGRSPLVLVSVNQSLSKGNQTKGLVSRAGSQFLQQNCAASATPGATGPQTEAWTPDAAAEPTAEPAQVLQVPDTHVLLRAQRAERIAGEVLRGGSLLFSR